MAAMKRYEMDIRETGLDISAERVFSQFMADVVKEHDARHARDMEEHQARMKAWEAGQKPKRGKIARVESDDYSIDS